MKLFSHLLLLVIGAAIGVWWGVKHPTQAENVTVHEQRIAAQAKLAALKEVQKINAAPSSNDKIKQMIAQNQKELDDANNKLPPQ